jgi:ubiquinone/menaquinone biosynthesis C-methylase UbiE
MASSAVRSNGMNKVSPEQVVDDLCGEWRTWTLAAGVQLGLFDHIAVGKQSAAEIAAAAGAAERGVERLLDALTGLGYLKKKNDGYGLSPVARKFLVSSSEFYIHGLAAFAAHMSQSWQRLAEVVRTGRPVVDVDSEKRAREFFPALVKHIFPQSFTAASAAVEALPAKTRNGIKSILDVAAGSGAWSIPFARALPAAHVTALDFPEVLSITREFADRFGVGDRFDYLEGNLRQTDFGRARYDLVILGHILHSEGEERARDLIRKSCAALNKGGCLLIADFVPNDRRTGPAKALLFGLNMLIHTEQGEVFTMRQLRGWLAESGFNKVKTIPAPAPSPLIVARC